MLIRKLLSLNEIFINKSISAKSAKKDLFDNSDASNIKKYETYWLDKSEKEMPQIIVASEKDALSIYADIATYYTSYSPISAYIHITPEFQNNIVEKEFNELQRKLLISLILAEAMSIMVSNNDDGEITYSICKRTLAYSLARATHINANTTTVAEKWLQLRLLTKLDYHLQVASAVTLINNLLINNRGLKNELLSKDLGWIIESYTSKKTDLLNYFSNIYPNLNEHIRDLRGSFDGRINALENIVRSIKNSQHSTEVDTLAIAYFTSLILPGSLQYLKYLNKYIKDYPAILIWYAFFTSNDDFDYKSIYSGLGLKLYRDITATNVFLNNPICDISVDELRVLSRIEIKQNVLKPTQQKLLLVSLVPGVEIYSRIPNDIDELQDHRLKDQTSTQASNSAFKQRKLIELLNEAQRIIIEDAFPPSTPKNSKRVYKK